MQNFVTYSLLFFTSRPDLLYDNTYRTNEVRKTQMFVEEVNAFTIQKPWKILTHNKIYYVIP